MKLSTLLIGLILVALVEANLNQPLVPILIVLLAALVLVLVAQDNNGPDQFA